MNKNNEIIDYFSFYLEIISLDREDYIISKEIQEIRERIDIAKKKVDILDNMSDLEKVKLLKRRKKE